MACARCVLDPRMHCFVPLSTLPSGARLFYTAPARSHDKDKEQILEMYHQHIRAAEGAPWVWVFDCGQMELRHYTSRRFTLGLAHILETQHRDTLQSILIVRPTLLVRTTLAVLQPLLPNTLLRKVRVIAEADPYWLPALRMDHGLSIANTSAIEAITRLPLDAVIPPLPPVR